MHKGIYLMMHLHTMRKFHRGNMRVQRGTRTPQGCQDMSRRCRFKGRIAPAEFNKVLESRCGFECRRTRRRSIPR